MVEVHKQRYQLDGPIGVLKPTDGSQLLRLKLGHMCAGNTKPVGVGKGDARGVGALGHAGEMIVQASPKRSRWDRLRTGQHTDAMVPVQDKQRLAQRLGFDAECVRQGLHIDLASAGM